MNITDIYQAKQVFNCATLKALAADLVALEVEHRTKRRGYVKCAGYERLAARYGTSSRTIKRVRQRMVKSGLLNAEVTRTLEAPATLHVPHLKYEAIP